MEKNMYMPAENGMIFSDTEAIFLIPPWVIRNTAPISMIPDAADGTFQE